jgi:hypothetical protein
VTCQIAVEITNEGRDNIQPGGGEEGGFTRQIMVMTTKQGRKDIQSGDGGRAHVRSWSRLQNEGRDDIQAGGGEGGKPVKSRWRVQNRVETKYSLEVEREDNASDHGCDYKVRAGTTYSLDVEMSDSSCDYKTGTGIMYQLEVKKEGNMSDHSWDHKTRAGTTYRLGVEWEVDTSNCGCSYKTRDNVHTGGGEGRATSDRGGGTK